MADPPPAYKAEDPAIKVKKEFAFEGTDYTVTYPLDANVEVELHCRYNPTLRKESFWYRMSAKLRISTPKLDLLNVNFRTLTVYGKHGFLMLDDPTMDKKELDLSPALLQTLRECNFFITE